MTPDEIEQLRAARKAAHDVFDTLWRGSRQKGKTMNRDAAYKWLARVMEKDEFDAHIRRMTLTECARLVELVKLKRAEMRRESIPAWVSVARQRLASEDWTGKEAEQEILRKAVAPWHVDSADDV